MAQQVVVVVQVGVKVLQAKQMDHQDMKLVVLALVLVLDPQLSTIQDGTVVVGHLSVVEVVEVEVVVETDTMALVVVKLMVKVKDQVLELLDYMELLVVVVVVVMAALRVVEKV